MGRGHAHDRVKYNETAPRARLVRNCPYQLRSHQQDLNNYIRNMERDQQQDAVDLEQGLLHGHRGGGGGDPDGGRYTGFLGYLLARVQGQPTVEELEMAREIKCLVGLPYDEGNPRHGADLLQFYEFLYPAAAEDDEAGRDKGAGTSTVNDLNARGAQNQMNTTSSSSGSRKKIQLRDERWKKVGFQSTNPATDFRGGGILSLYCMMYLAEKYGEETRRMIAESQQEESFYLFACACINVTVQLIFYLKLETPEMVYQGCDIPVAPVATKKKVMHALSESHYQARDAFGELFSKAVMKLHTIWLDMSHRPEGVTLLNFGEALEKNLRAIRRTCQGASTLDRLEDFAALMGVDPDKWSTAVAGYYSDCCNSLSETTAAMILSVMSYTRSVEYSSRPPDF
ncbi:unnamed protein product [Amoebophrya sp. A120]|nr:unnamed protein product [Amoebophrya sp. A120]|eukprot:GSA120T00018015001.1